MTYWFDLAGIRVVHYILYRQKFLWLKTIFVFFLENREKDARDRVCSPAELWAVPVYTHALRPSASSSVRWGQ